MRITAGVVGASVVLAVGLSSGSALAAPSAHTLTVTTKLVRELRYRHNQITLAELIQRRAVVGTDEGDCVLGSTIRCSAAYALTGGMIYARVIATRAGERASITGGTGQYAGAHGTLEIAHESRTSLRLTFHYTD